MVYCGEVALFKTARHQNCDECTSITSPMMFFVKSLSRCQHTTQTNGIGWGTNYPQSKSERQSACTSSCNNSTSPKNIVQCLLVSTIENSSSMASLFAPFHTAHKSACCIFDQSALRSLKYPISASP